MLRRHWYFYSHCSFTHIDKARWVSPHFHSHHCKFQCHSLHSSFHVFVLIFLVLSAYNRFLLTIVYFIWLLNWQKIPSRQHILSSVRCISTAKHTDSMMRLPITPWREISYFPIMLYRDSLSCWRSVGRMLVNTGVWSPAQVCVWKACSLLTTSPLKVFIVTWWWEYMMGMISSPRSWACWPSPWPSLWVGSQRCSGRRRTRWAPQTQTRNRSRSRRLKPWWPTLEAERSGRLPSAWSWWEQSWSLWKEHRVEIRVLHTHRLWTDSQYVAFSSINSTFITISATFCSWQDNKI